MTTKLKPLIDCKYCKKLFRKKTYHHEFCKKKCKETYHNKRRHLKKQDDYIDNIHPFSSEALGQE